MQQKLTKMKEIWGKEREKIIRKKAWIKGPIIPVQIFCKDYIAVMQTYVGGGNDPAA